MGPCCGEPLSHIQWYAPSLVRLAKSQPLLAILLTAIVCGGEPLCLSRRSLWRRRITYKSMLPQGWIAKIPTFARNFAYCGSLRAVRNYQEYWEYREYCWLRQAPNGVPPAASRQPGGKSCPYSSVKVSICPFLPPSTVVPGLPRPPAAPAAHTQHSPSQRQEFTVSYRFYRHQPHCRACPEGRRQWMQCLKCARRSARLNGDPQLEKLKKNPQKINLHP